MKLIETASWKFYLQTLVIINPDSIYVGLYRMIRECISIS
ncbi:hypothetical Protein YC6258_01312 [Gynuella sunshinyii YC6258]|uniref:Uncharacterized protein n=1 Tax=Gynuella sunshinyii YC6258 TaxID=1445510 RepID=A0A0C5V1F2_9GAMM|nr:hypothetical Protein YC6258_01312 [Gynuella sunshinyii YC6258]